METVKGQDTVQEQVCKCGAHVSGDVPYCPSCGELLSVAKISVVSKKDYDSLKDEKLKVERQLSYLMLNGYAPNSRRILEDEEYNELRKKAKRLENIRNIGQIVMFIVLGWVFLYAIMGVSHYLFYDEIQKEEGKYGVRKPFDLWDFPTIPFEYDKIIKDSTYNAYYVYQGKKVGVYDDDGNMTIPCEMDSIRPVGNDMAIMYRNGMQGVCHRDGHIIIPCENQYVFWEKKPAEWTWDIPYIYIGNIIPVKHSTNSGWDIYDKSGHRINLFSYQDAVQTGEPDLLKVKINGHYGLVNSKGEDVLKCKAYYLSRFREGIAFYCDDVSPFYAIDRSGNRVFTLPEGCTISLFYESRLRVKNKEGKWGYYDKTGKKVIDYQFETAWDFVGDSARISYNGQNGYVFKDGTIKLEAE